MDEKQAVMCRARRQYRLEVAQTCVAFLEPPHETGKCPGAYGHMPPNHRITLSQGARDDFDFLFRVAMLYPAQILRE